MRQCGWIAAALLAGCEYGPEHLDGLYWQRDEYMKWVERYQGYIDEVEEKYHIPSRDKERIAKEEAARKAKEEEDKAFQEWFATLTPDQRFQWMLAEQRNEIQRERMRTEKLEVLLQPLEPRPVTVINNSVETTQTQGQSQRRWP